MISLMYDIDVLVLIGLFIEWFDVYVFEFGIGLLCILVLSGGILNVVLMFDCGGFRMVFWCLFIVLLLGVEKGVLCEVWVFIVLGGIDVLYFKCYVVCEDL